MQTVSIPPAQTRLRETNNKRRFSLIAEMRQPKNVAQGAFKENVG
jgi:hypothetical protein